MNKLKIGIIAVVGFILLGGAVILGFFVLADIDTARGGPVDHSRAVDGIYTGHFRSGPNRAEVEVTIKSGEIKEINVIRNVASWIGKKASRVIPQRIVAEQSTRVDSVTGATRSSFVIMNAVEKAVQSSYKEKEFVTD